jgi:hypothetical protein
MPEGYYVPFSAVADAPYGTTSLARAPKRIILPELFPRVVSFTCKDRRGAGEAPIRALTGWAWDELS